MVVVFNTTITFNTGEVFHSGSVSCIADQKGVLHRIADPAEEQYPPMDPIADAAIVGVHNFPVAHGSAISLRHPPRSIRVASTPAGSASPSHCAACPRRTPPPRPFPRLGSRPKAPRIHRTPALAPWFLALDPPPPLLPITASPAPTAHLHRALVPVSGARSETPMAAVRPAAAVRSGSETPTASPSASPSPSAPGTPTVAVASPAPVAGPRPATGFTEKSPLHLAASPTVRS
eukprot:XP_008657738.1 vegetative cell wall protein gp1-like [Zea mays]